MRSLEFEIGQLVIERLGIKVHHIALASLVVRVAVFTVMRQILVQPPMVALTLVNIGFDIFVVMTGEAASRLARFLQSLMTAFALLFELGMVLDQVSGHQQQIQLAGHERHGSNKQGDQDRQQYRLPDQVLHR